MIQESYLHSSEDLGNCFELLERSAYYDFSLQRREVIAAWKKLTREGIGHFLRAEYQTPSKVSGTANSSFLSLFFTVFVTREYATHLVKNVAIKNVVMDFLRWYYEFHFEQIGTNPCPTPAELEAGGRFALPHSNDAFFSEVRGGTASIAANFGILPMDAGVSSSLFWWLSLPFLVCRYC